MIRKLFIATVAIIAAICASAQNRLAKGDINLIVASDLGRNGYYEQKKVAETMGEVADHIGPEAVLALGDTHHYEGVQKCIRPSLDDQLRADLFSSRAYGRMVSDMRQS